LLKSVTPLLRPSSTKEIGPAIAELPVLVSVTAWLLLPPTFTFPKLKLVGLAARVPDEGGEVIVTVAEADLVGSALLVAVTKAVPGLEGAV